MFLPVLLLFRQPCFSLIIVPFWSQGVNYLLNTSFEQCSFPCIGDKIKSATRFVSMSYVGWGKGLPFNLNWNTPFLIYPTLKVVPGTTIKNHFSMIKIGYISWYFLIPEWTSHALADDDADPEHMAMGQKYQPCDRWVSRFVVPTWYPTCYPIALGPIS